MASSDITLGWLQTQSKEHNERKDFSMTDCKNIGRLNCTNKKTMVKNFLSQGKLILPCLTWVDLRKNNHSSVHTESIIDIVWPRLSNYVRAPRLCDVTGSDPITALSLLLAAESLPCYRRALIWCFADLKALRQTMSMMVDFILNPVSTWKKNLWKTEKKTYSTHKVEVNIRIWEISFLLMYTGLKKDCILSLVCCN